MKSNGVEIMIVNHEKLSPQEELVNDLLSKEIGGIVEKYSVAIKKKQNICSIIIAFFRGIKYNKKTRWRRSYAERDNEKYN